MIRGTDERRSEWNALELQGAQLCAITANLNRDPRKQKKAYTPADFTFFHDSDDAKPEQQAAAAFWTLVERNRMPGWALFCLQDFKQGKGKTYPGDPAFIGDGIVLLAPVETGKGLKGVMLAEGKVSGKQVAGRWEGHRMLVSVPKFDGFVVAQADTELIILRELAEGVSA